MSWFGILITLTGDGEVDEEKARRMVEFDLRAIGSPLVFHCPHGEEVEVYGVEDLLPLRDIPASCNKEGCWWVYLNPLRFNVTEQNPQGDGE